MSDPAVVGAEYVDETRLAVRKAAHSGAEGPDAREVLFDAIVEAQPRRILELGPGEGELAERLVRELGNDVVAVDQSERMVEITRGKASTRAWGAPSSSNSRMRASTASLPPGCCTTSTRSSVAWLRLRGYSSREVDSSP